MEVKELNSNAALAILGKSNAASVSAGMIGDAFSSLLESKIATPDFSKETNFAAKSNVKADVAPVTKPEAKEAKPVENKDKAPAADKKADKKNSSTKEDKVSKPAAEKESGVETAPVAAPIEAPVQVVEITPEMVDEIVSSVLPEGAKELKATKKELKSNLEQPIAELVPEENAEGVSVAKGLDFGKNVKVEVTVAAPEEKIAQSKTSDLLSDTFAVDAAAASDDAAEFKLADMMASDNGTQTSAPAQQTPAPHLQAQASISAQANIAAAQVQVANNVEAAADMAQEIAPEVKSINAAQAASGSEFVNHAKAQAAEQLRNSSNDTYKGMSREVAEQVKVNITKSAIKGVDKIEIQLKPEDLGHIEIKMHLAKNGKLQAEIVASRPETMEMLQKESQSLQKSFEDAGFQTDENSLSFSCRDDNSQAGGNQERNTEMRKFMSEVLESDFSNDNLSGYAESSWDGQTGLNIRV